MRSNGVNSRVLARHRPAALLKNGRDAATDGDAIMDFSTFAKLGAQLFQQ
jgi:hypothetical protein